MINIRAHCGIDILYDSFGHALGTSQHILQIRQLQVLHDGQLHNIWLFLFRSLVQCQFQSKHFLSEVHYSLRFLFQLKVSFSGLQFQIDNLLVLFGQKPISSLNSEILRIIDRWKQFISRTCSLSNHSVSDVVIIVCMPSSL